MRGDNASAQRSFSVALQHLRRHGDDPIQVVGVTPRIGASLAETIGALDPSEQDDAGVRSERRSLDRARCGLANSEVLRLLERAKWKQ
jgi:hypothetical protein